MKKLIKLLRVSLSFVQLTADEILSRATAIYAGVNNNPAYPNPPIDMPTFKAAIDGLQSAIAEAADGGKKAIAQCAHQAHAVIKILRQLAAYVEVACQGDLTVLLTSGFTAVWATRLRATPLTESIRNIAPGSNILKANQQIAISRGVASKTPSAIDGKAFGGLPTPSFFHSAATLL